MAVYQPLPQTWSSSLRFVLVCTAAVVSLSDFWRMPFLLATYGGGAFLIVYLAALLGMGLPLLSGQLLMARDTHTDLPGVMALWVAPSAHSRFWVWGAYLTLIGAGLLLAAYSVVAGWSLAYCLRGLTGGLDTQSLDMARGQFVAFARDTERGFGWLMLFVVLLVATAARGINRSVEPVMRTLALCMLGLFVLLVVVAALDSDAGAAARSLWHIDFSQLGVRGVLEALYQAFFSLSLGTGVIVALGTNLAPRAPVIRISLLVILFTVLAGLASAFVLRVLVQQQGLQLGGGVQSLFEVLPTALGTGWQTTLVYLLVALVSVSTGIGLFEPLVQAVQHRSGLSRLRSSCYVGVGVALLGLLAMLSFGPLARWRWFGQELFGWMIIISTQLLVPLTGLMLCLLMGRVLARRRLVAAWRTEDNAGRTMGFAVWHGLLRYPTRIALVVVLAYALGGLRLIEIIW
jgi:NSS family neurotransmitter:Na+ symporter